MEIEYVVLVVNIDDPSATRIARQKSKDNEKDFFFMFPREYFEYDPESFYYILDESITDSRDFDVRLRKRMEQAKSRGDFKQYSMKNLSNCLNHFAKVLIFCKGNQVMNDILLDLKDLCDQNPDEAQLSFRKCDPEYDHFEDLFSFNSFLQKILDPNKVSK